MDCAEPASRWIGKRGRSRNLMLEFEQDSAIGIRSQGLGMIYFRRVAAAHEDGCVHAMHCKFEILQQWKHLISRLSSSHSAFSLEKPCSPRLNILTSRLVRKNWTKQRSTLNLNTTDLAARSLPRSHYFSFGPTQSARFGLVGIHMSILFLVNTLGT